MRSPALSVLFVLLITMPLSRSLPGSQRRPGLREAEKRINAPLDPPVFFAKKGPDPSRLQEEAAELAKLSAGIPAGIERVNQGQLPKTLNEQLKRIEKLAKRLRSEVAQ
jgi:hypothetical protein